jgi:methionyl-tRNA formyltransferase
MKLVFYCAGGELGLRPLEAAAANHHIAAVVRAAPGGPLVRRVLGRTARAVGLRRDPIHAWTRRHGVPSLTATSGDDPRITLTLQRLEPDLICISTFPWLLHSSVLDLARHGALNIHPSLLPRHRGPNPYFWTYYHGDPESGVTVHQATARADAGPILRQESFPVPRGLGVARLHTQCARLGASLLQQALREFERAIDTATVQDESLATPAPRVKPGVPMVDYERWDVRQVWHFLAGLYPHHREPVFHEGRRIAYRAVLGFQAVDGATGRGALEPAPYGWNLLCRGGYVQLARRRGATRPRTDS